MGKRRGPGRIDAPISGQAADEFDIVSRVDGKIGQLNTLERSLLFAEVSMLSYLHDDVARPVFESVGFSTIRYIERDGAQAYELGTEHDMIVTCRGTEPNEWNDVKADANALTDVAETIGRVHRGFKREVDDIWPTLQVSLLDETRTVWFCGHSLGGAMATICAGRTELMESGPTVGEVHTFGSPRVGTKRYVQHAGVTHYRWVHNNDIVTRTPPRLFGYRHSGRQMYLDRNGDLRHLTPALRGRDRWSGFFDGVKQRRFDHFSDHAIAGYVAHVRRAAERQVTPQRPRRLSFIRRKDRSFLQ